MLTAHQLHIDGRRHTLLPPTTVEASRGKVTLVQADGQERRTALALALTGRMSPSAGTVALGHADSLASLRKRSAIVDSPEVNAPEHHLTVRSLASEDLALVPLKFRDRTRPSAWLAQRGFHDITGKWVEELEPARLLHLQLELALANQFVELVVVDSPDRHTADPAGWLDLLERVAAGEIGRPADVPDGTPARELVVVGVVGRFPDGWDGPSAVAGHPPEAPEPSSTGTAPSPDIDKLPTVTMDAVEADALADVAPAPGPPPGEDDGATHAAAVVPEEAADSDETTEANEAGESK